jgi:hypothetical protein
MIEPLNDLVGHIGQALGEEGHEERVTALRRGTLERLGTGLAGRLPQELGAVGIESLQCPVFHDSGSQEGELLQISEDGPRGVGDRGAPQPDQ